MAFSSETVTYFNNLCDLLKLKLTTILKINEDTGIVLSIYEGSIRVTLSYSNNETTSSINIKDGQVEYHYISGKGKSLLTAFKDLQQNVSYKIKDLFETGYKTSKEEIRKALFLEIISDFMEISGVINTVLRIYPSV